MRLALVLVMPVATPALAQQVTTAADIRPILAATSASLAPVGGQGTAGVCPSGKLVPWLGAGAVCGRVPGVGVAARLTVTASPKAIQADRLRFSGLPADTMQTVVLLLGDGAELRQDFTRAAVLMP